MKTILIAILAIAILSGCATQKTVDMAASYNEAYEQHAKSEAEKVDSKALAIADVMAFDCDDGTEACGAAKALSGLIAAREIAEIKSAPFTLEKHATDVDAQIKAVETIGDGIPFITVGAVAYKAIDKDKGSVTNNADNGATVNNSYDEDHATNFGEDGVVSNYPAQDNHSESIETIEE